MGRRALRERRGRWRRAGRYVHRVARPSRSEPTALGIPDKRCLRARAEQTRTPHTRQSDDTGGSASRAASRACRSRLHTRAHTHWRRLRAGPRGPRRAPRCGRVSDVGSIDRFASAASRVATSLAPPKAVPATSTAPLGKLRRRRAESVGGRSAGSPAGGLVSSSMSTTREPQA